MSIKPPLGLKPWWLAAEHRVQDVDAAINRYQAVQQHVPLKWIAERCLLRILLQAGPPKVMPTTSPKTP